MNNIYETIMILTPNLDTDVIGRIKMFYLDLFQKGSNRKRVRLDDIGKKKLAYKIQDKYEYGYYLIFYYESDSDYIYEIERALRKDDMVLKYITIRQDEDDIELPDLIPESISKQTISEQTKPDAYDVLLGLADYNDKNLTND